MYFENSKKRVNFVVQLIKKIQERKHPFPDLSTRSQVIQIFTRKAMGTFLIYLLFKFYEYVVSSCNIHCGNSIRIVYCIAQHSVLFKTNCVRERLYLYKFKSMYTIFCIHTFFYCIQ